MPPSVDEVEEALVLDAVAEGARGGDQRVLEARGRRRSTARLHAAVSSRVARAARATTRLARPHHVARVEHRPLGAGAAVLRPRVARRAGCGTTQPRQVPTPQPIQGSRLTCGRQAARARRAAPPRAASRRGRRRRARPGRRAASRCASSGSRHAAVDARGCRPRSRRTSGTPQLARSGSRSCRSAVAAPAVEDPRAARPRARSSSPKKQEGRDAVAAGDQQRLGRLGRGA